MRLIAIVLALWLSRYDRGVDRWRSPGPFFRYFDAVYPHLRPRQAGAGIGAFLGLLLPPVLLFAFLQWLFSGWLLGLVNLLLGVWALLFAHGPGSVDEQVRAFAGAWREGRADDARMAAQALSGGDAVPDASANLPALVVEGFFWQSFRRVFPALFWFVLLGPVGAIAVQVVELVRQYSARQGEAATGVEQAASALAYALDWLPARGMAIALGLAGSFVHAIEGWRDSLSQPDEGGRGLVVKAALGALNEPTYVAEPDAVEELLANARALVTRALMVWLAVVALLTLGGIV